MSNFNVNEWIIEITETSQRQFQAKLKTIIKQIKSDAKKPCNFTYKHIMPSKHFTVKNRIDNKTEEFQLSITYGQLIYMNSFSEIEITFNNETHEISLLELDTMVNHLEPTADTCGNWSFLYNLNLKDFQNKLKQSLKYTHKDINKKKLTLIHFSDGEIVTTDSFQMCRIRIAKKSSYHTSINDFNLTQNQVKTLINLPAGKIDVVEIYQDATSKKIRFDIGREKQELDTSIAFEYRSTDYISYNSIATTTDHTYNTDIKIDIKHMQSVLKKLKPAIAKECPVMVFETENRLTLKANNNDSRLETLVTLKNHPTLMKDRIGLDYKYFANMVTSLKALKFKEFTLQLKVDGGVILLQQENITLTVMSMDID